MHEVESRLNAKGIRREDFRAICGILLTKGLLSRSEGGDSLRLYDVAARCEAELTDYLTFAFPIILINTLRPPHFRLIPSHHRDVGLDDPDEDLETRREIKQSVVQALAAALLALRMLYDEQLVDKKMDAAGRIGVRLTELTLFMNTTFGIGLPATKADQRALFMKLKKHGAIDVRIDALADEDAVIVIRPEILTLVLDQNVRAAQAVFEVAQSAGLPGEENTPSALDAAEPQPSSGKADEPKSAQIISLERTDRSAPSHT
ncbi:MAG: hypothetical protein Q8M24_16180 [Pseudolabrys sp.]|nr:hypothetical protein [Pseudolabrys sp.]MDP2296981.1 hypothetical protein [Pseudolabrys sp.]